MAVGETFEEGILLLEEFGLTDVLLPFLLIFTIVFAVLQKTNIMGQDKKNINVILSLTLGLLVVIPHVTHSYPPDADIVDIMNHALPQVSLLIVALMLLIIMVGIFYPTQYGAGSWTGIATVIGLVGLIWIFGASIGWFDGWDWFLNTFGEDAVTLAIVLIVFAIIISFVTKSNQTPGTKLFQSIDQMFRGPGHG